MKILYYITLVVAILVTMGIVATIMLLFLNEDSIILKFVCALCGYGVFANRKFIKKWFKIS